MIAATLRLLALVALILMPLGMGMGTARAQTSADHAMAMGPPASGHCGDQDKGKPGSSSMHCSGSCSALPDATLGQAEAIDPIAPPPPTRRIVPMIGKALVPSTPPPRTA